jgi:hypothetical protein
MKRLSKRMDDRSWRRLKQALRQPRVCWSVWCVAGGMVGALLYLYSPEATGWYPRCPFHFFTGLDCPGCGSLRALHAVLHGRLVEAFCCNPLLMVCLPMVGTWLAVRIFGALALNRTVELRLPSSVSFAIALVVVLFFIVRNVPAIRAKQLAADSSRLQAVNVAYQVQSGTNVSDRVPDQVLAVCPIHNHLIRRDGTLKRGAARGSQP